MESAGFILTSNALSALVGKHIIGFAINDATGSIYSSVGAIFNYNTKINDTITKLDILEIIKMVNLSITDITYSNSTIEQCLNSIHEIIIEIREDLKQINIKVDEHKNKYFSNWRYLNCKKELRNLTIHSNILEKRYEYLIKCLSIINYGDKSSSKKILLKYHKND